MIQVIIDSIWQPIIPTSCHMYPLCSSPRYNIFIFFIFITSPQKSSIFTSWWFQLISKNICQIRSFPPNRDENKKCLSCHHLVHHFSRFSLHPSCTALWGRSPRKTSIRNLGSPPTNWTPNLLVRRASSAWRRQLHDIIQRLPPHRKKFEPNMDVSENRGFSPQNLSIKK